MSAALGRANALATAVEVNAATSTSNPSTKARAIQMPMMRFWNARIGCEAIASRRFI
jgi:hypothetical protein